MSSVKRLEWLDALRGFTMFLVVANHTYGFGFDTNTKYSMFMSLCLLFRMPMFFFRPPSRGTCATLARW